MKAALLCFLVYIRGVSRNLRWKRGCAAYTVAVRKWVLFSAVVGMASAASCLSQGKGVIAEKLPLDKNPEISRRCPKNDYLHVDWVDDNTILAGYVLQPCRKGDPIRFGYTLLDVHGKTLASTDSQTRDGDFRSMQPGPNGEVLGKVWKHGIQVLDTHFELLTMIDCGATDCVSYVSADRTGFAVCGVPPDACRYFRGRGFEEARAEDFPDGFPLLDMMRKSRSPAAAKDLPVQNSVGKGESWFFRDGDHLFRVKAGGKPEELPRPGWSLLESQCSGMVSVEGHDRFLADCGNGIALGEELVLYESGRIVLYDVPSGRILFKLNTGTSRARWSPDGRRIAVERVGPSGETSVTVYYVP
jgi:hypothetical protein